LGDSAGIFGMVSCVWNQSSLWKFFKIKICLTGLVLMVGERWCDELDILENIHKKTVQKES